MGACEDLNAWLDAEARKPRKPFSRVDSVDELLEAFDLLRRRRGGDDFAIPSRMLEIYDQGQQGMEGRGAGIRRTQKWHFSNNLAKPLVPPLVPQMMNKIKQAVKTRHKINYRSGYELRNVENGEYTVYYTNINSPWFSKLSKTKEWLTTQEELRLQGAQIDRPNTKWVFQRHMLVDLKVILDRQPLQIGLGRLPDWLRNKHEVISLDTFNDNLCIFRCIAVHQGANKQFITRRARELAQSFFAAYRKLPSITLQQFHLLVKHFKQGIAAFSVTNAGDFILTYQPSHYDKVSYPTMNIGLYEGHAFLIKDINKASNNYTCGECMARFTRASDFTRHAPRCTSGRTEISCPGNRILSPESAFEKAFYPEGRFGKKATCWLEYVSRQSGTHIHHHRCGHGGERLIGGAPVDGYHPETKTVFQFHGCHWHGCIKWFPNPEQRTEVIHVDKNGNEITRDAAY